MKQTKSIFLLIAVFILCLQWIIMSNVNIRPGLLLYTILPGICIFSAAFILSWAAEVAQFYIPQSLALSFLALIAVLPEYAVDMYFAWTAGKNPAYISYASANMTGGNRLLVGFGWFLVIFLFFLKTKKNNIQLDTTHRTEINTLLIATLYSFIIPLKGNLTLIDTIILILIFILYVIKISKGGIKEPELEEGPSEIIARLPSKPRLITTIFLFLFAGYAIYISAGPFSEGLLEIGEKTKIDKFILVQWIAPLASESPEIIVASIFAIKSLPSAALKTLISSKINQWTLLVGMLPLIYNISSLKLSAMILDIRQTEEILLTSCQSLFALMVLYNLRFSIFEGFLLFFLFFTQLFFPSTTIRFIYSGLYIVLAIYLFLFRKKE